MIELIKRLIFRLSVCSIKNSPKTIDKNQYDFWNTNLDDIESSFLPKGKRITDLPVCIDLRIL